MSRDESRGVWILAVGQTAGFAALLYMFGAIILALEDGSGWSRAELALGPTLALLAQAALAPFSGRLVDGGHGGRLLAGAALLGAACLALLSQVTHLAAWYAIWMVLGAAQAASLYETCFSFLLRRLGPEARRAIIRVTLVAGLASTFAFPIGAWAGEALGWRGAILLFAGIEALITLPANIIGVRLLRRGERRGGERAELRAGAVRAVLRRPEFWALALYFGLMMGNHMMLTTYALPILTERGAAHALAVLVASSVGPMQVAGRLLLTLPGLRVGTGTLSRVIALGMSGSSFALLVAAGDWWLFAIYAVGQGASIGVQSVLRPLITAEALGQENFGAISGALAMAPLGAGAVAPFLGAILIGAGGVTLLLSVTLGFALLAFAIGLWLRARGI
ncbi:MFS transporter [Albidovulum sediminicola]|uniref:MFS transporter n=1 Tax=Albidovulum sediminicola TaxID=2984331 RepID=A0ABT2YZH1_9RHOB|nr:MFS transporter [Defluviimonas sp. WL0075]MCV2864190.1 MFS transporter [Defluviimonas sp. WL0075]